MNSADARDSLNTMRRHCASSTKNKTSGFLTLSRLTPNELLLCTLLSPFALTQSCFNRRMPTLPQVGLGRVRVTESGEVMS
jgi:hypothetical protein